MAGNKTMRREEQECAIYYPSVQVRVPAAKHLLDLGRRLGEIFHSCGFNCEVVRSLSSPKRGALIETHPSMRSVADDIEAAFRQAGIKVDSQTNTRCAEHVVVVNIGSADAF